MENDIKESKRVKIILLGDSGVGKTCIINRYLNNEFISESCSTFGSYPSKKEVIKSNNKFLLSIWDTTGQEKYHSITDLFIKGADIVILVYSIDSKASFDGLNYWYNSVKEKLKEKNYILAITGNKSDLADKEEVSEEEGKIYAKEKNAKFKLVSAKEDIKGINTLFDSLLIEFINNILIERIDSESTVISKQKKKIKKRCC